MRYVDRTLSDLSKNLALDEALLLQAEAGETGECLRVWEWPDHAVVLGVGCSLNDDVDEDRCCRDRIPVIRRSSGGGTVLLGAGCLLFSLILSYERAAALRSVRRSYAYILDIVRRGLCDIVPGIELAGVSDLAIAGRKFSGNAQQRKRDFLLHHGTILYDFDIEITGRVLRLPLRQPDYRKSRPHEAFMTNIPAPANQLKESLPRMWQATPDETQLPTQLIEALAREKYFDQML